jgi:hypothetical protein
MKRRIDVEIDVIIRSGTIDYPYEDTWEETETMEVRVDITSKDLAKFLNKGFGKMSKEEQEVYIRALDHMYDYAPDQLDDWMDYDEDFQDYLKELAHQEYEDNYK